MSVCLVLGTLLVVSRWFGNDALTARLESIRGLSVDGSVEGRIEAVRTTLRIMGERPFGIGFGRIGREVINEHNTYAFVAGGTGVLGLVAFLGAACTLLLAFMRDLGRPLEDELSAITCGGFYALVCLSVNVMGDVVVMETFQSAGLAVAVGIALAARNVQWLEKRQAAPGDLPGASDGATIILPGV